MATSIYKAPECPYHHYDAETHYFGVCTCTCEYCSKVRRLMIQSLKFLSKEAQIAATH